jgi:hypothetical protein
MNSGSRPSCWSKASQPVRDGRVSLRFAWMTAWELIIVRDVLPSKAYAGPHGRASVHVGCGPNEVIEVTNELPFGCQAIDYGGTTEWCSIHAALSVLDAAVYVRVTTVRAYEGTMGAHPQERWWRIENGSTAALEVPSPPKDLPAPIATASDDGEINTSRS